MELAHGISTWAMECVSNGSLDAAFFMGDGLHSNVRALPLVELSYRVVAPAAWRAQIESAGWSAIAALPWIRPPRHSPHQRMQQSLFEPRKLNPATVVEADQESSISTLVKAGVGLGLMRDDLALAAERAGEVCVWGGGGASTTLSFVYARDREDDEVIEALARGSRRSLAARGREVAAAQAPPGGLSARGNTLGTNGTTAAAALRDAARGDAAELDPTSREGVRRRCSRRPTS